MNIQKIWENYFLKKRYIFAYKDYAENSDRVTLLSMDNPDIKHLISTSDLRFSKYLSMRQGNPNWVLFYYKENDEIHGYGFLHIPVKEEWNDCLPTVKGQARVGSVYVYPKHRGKGIRGVIAKCQIQYSQEHNLKLWSVIEASNKASIRAASKTGFINRHNYLCKIIGVNIVSIMTNPFKVYLLLGDKRARR